MVRPSILNQVDISCSFNHLGIDDVIQPELGPSATSILPGATNIAIQG